MASRPQVSISNEVSLLKLCPGTQQLTYFRRLGLVALNSFCVIVSEIRTFLVLTRKRSFTWTFLFSNARWLFDNLQLSKVSFCYFAHLFKHLLAVILLKYLVITNDNDSPNKAHLLDFRYLIFFSTSGLLISVSSLVNIDLTHKRTTYS